MNITKHMKCKSTTRKRKRSPVATSACSTNQVSRPSESHYHKFKIVVNAETKDSMKNIVYCEWLFDYKECMNGKTEQNRGDEHFGQRLDQILDTWYILENIQKNIYISYETQRSRRRVSSCRSVWKIQVFCLLIHELTFLEILKWKEFRIFYKVWIFSEGINWVVLDVDHLPS